MPAKVELPNLDNLIERYRNGESILAISQDIGISRDIIRFRFIEHGVKLRSRSELTSMQMRNLSAESRRKQTKSANKAARGRKHSIGEKRKRAATNEALGFNRIGCVSPHEMQLHKMLKKRDIETIPQMAIEQYNIDLGIREPAVAIECFRGGVDPNHTGGLDTKQIKRYTRRIHNLINYYRFICVFGIPTSEGVDTIVSIVDLIRRNHPPSRAYWVIAGNGQLLPARKSYLNSRTIESELEASLQSLPAGTN